MEQDDDHSTFPPEWTLPDLPKSTVPPLLSAEFDEIFHSSSNTSNLAPLIGLQDDDKSLGLVRLDDDTRNIILSSIEESLEIDPPGSLEVEETVINSDDTRKGEEGGKTKDVTADENFEKDLALLKEETPTANDEESFPVVEQEETVGTTENEEEVTGDLSASAIRRSKRLKTLKNETCEEREYAEVKKGLIESTEANVPLMDESKSLPLAESQKEEKEEEQSAIAPNSSDEEADSDDPDKVWCICQQPHDDRFMICCDRCGEWYHGDCVGITVAEGKKMEKCGKEYICIRCNDYDAVAKAERAKNRSLRQSRREQIRAKQIAELVVKKGDSSPLPKKVTVTCTGPGCDKVAVLPSIYCSDICIKKHIEFSLKKLQVRGLSRSSTTPGEFGKGSGGVTVIETRTKKILTGLSAPSEKSLLSWLKTHPSYKVYVPSAKVVTASKKPLNRKSHDDDKSEGEATTPTYSSNKLSDINIRKHAQKALRQVLQSRTLLLPVEERVAEESVSKLAVDIEMKLFNLYNQEINQKYRNKCRSLLFNLKDTKNQGLFKKILLGELSTRQLVRMTPEQLASEELAEWREKTIKKELDMITEVAKEQLEMSSSSVVRKMTYKGEIEIERNTELSVVDVPTKSQDEVTSTTSDSLESTSLPGVTIKEEPMDSIVHSLLNDTTDKHGSHVFDQNCAICTGKQASSVKSEQRDSEDYSHPSPTSPDSQMATSDIMEHVVTSPDSISQPYVAPPTSSLQCLWRGNISMHAMKTFPATAYHVSGRTQGLSEMIPEALQIIGRIAHAQVWDYLDKLRCSTSKEVVVLRFERIDDDDRAYLEMLDYLIQKRRYGVMQCGAYVKDMYFVPLPSNESVPAQLLPFDGPGLPFNRRDTFICIMTRAKNVNISTSNTPRKRKYSGHVHFDNDSPDVVAPPEKKPHSSSQRQAEVGFGGSTPPTTPTPVKVSFYGNSDDFDKKPPVAKPESEATAGSAVSDNSSTSTLSKVTGLSHSGIKSILSTLSDEKLQELASAMSTIQPSEVGGASSAPLNQTGDSQMVPTPKLDSRLSLDERLSAIQASLKHSAPPTNRPTSAKAMPVDHAPSTSFVPHSYDSMGTNPPLNEHRAVMSPYYFQHDSTYSDSKYHYTTRPPYRYQDEEEETASYPSSSMYHSESSSYQRNYREDYHSERSSYWKERDHSGYRKSEDSRHGDEGRYDRRESERGPQNHSHHHHHHHRTDRWSK